MAEQSTSGAQRQQEEEEGAGETSPLPHELCDNYLRHIMVYCEQRKVNRHNEKKRQELARFDSPLHLSLEIYRRGAAAVAKRREELSLTTLDPSAKNFEKFEKMLQAVHLYFRAKDMRLEPFQLDLLRGTVIGISWNQLQDDLFKYKHRILDLLGLATPEVRAFNPRIPNPAVTRLINEIFAVYDKPYTLGMAPRQCGKTTIVSVILACCLIFLNISILVIAQNKNMSETIQSAVTATIEEIQAYEWFEPEWRCEEGRASSDTRVFVNRAGYKKDSRVTFVSSSPNVSI